MNRSDLFPQQHRQSLWAKPSSGSRPLNDPRRIRLLLNQPLELTFLSGGASGAPTLCWRRTLRQHPKRTDAGLQGGDHSTSPLTKAGNAADWQRSLHHHIPNAFNRCGIRPPNSPGLRFVR